MSRFGLAMCLIVVVTLPQGAFPLTCLSSSGESSDGKTLTSGKALESKQCGTGEDRCTKLVTVASGKTTLDKGCGSASDCLIHNDCVDGSTNGNKMTMCCCNEDSCNGNVGPGVIAVITFLLLAYVLGHNTVYSH